MKKAVYIGAGSDVRPVICYPDIKIFIYIDSQPNNEFGAVFYKPYSRPLFKNNMINHFSFVNFKLKKESKNLLEFENENTEQIVKYYINTYIPDNYCRIKDDVKDWDTLIVAGHNPDNIIMESRNKETKITFIGFKGTYYGNEFEKEDKNTIVKDLHDNNIKFDNYLYNITRDWYSLYYMFENTPLKVEIDEELDLLPCYLQKVDKNIIIRINNYYNSKKVTKNNYIYSDWKKYISKIQNS